MTNYNPRKYQPSGNSTSSQGVQQSKHCSSWMQFSSWAFHISRLSEDSKKYRDPFSLKREFAFWKFPSTPLLVRSPIAQVHQGKSPSASFQLLLCWHEKFKWCRGKWCNFRATVCYYCSRTNNSPLDILKGSKNWGWFSSSGIHDLKLTKIWTYFPTSVVSWGAVLNFFFTT